MDDFDRAFVLMDALDDAVAERVEPTRHGDVVVDSRIPLVHDRNFARAKHPQDASAQELAAEAEAVQSRVRGVQHRRVNLRDAKAIGRLEAEFVALGWEPQRFVLMAHRRKPDRAAEHHVLEVDEPTLRPLWAEGIRGQPHGQDERLVRQILEHHRGIATGFPTRLFAIQSEGRLVAHCELYRHETVGQVENVATLPRFRERGFARALVLHAVAESQKLGNDLTFLVADADGWPRRLYERLGFDLVGRYARFLKARPAAP